ncbi:MAG: DUF6265 family protein [Xanthomonadales bacterium]|nr:DUF6265 family protein [Xanthomonadales bacterium]
MNARAACLGLLLTMVTLAARAEPECGSLDELAWLAGHWEARTSNSRIVERWTRVSDATAEGYGEVYDRASGELKSREVLRLVEMGGTIFYLPKVAHNPLPIAFRLTSCGPKHATFENPDHDFPTRIAYRMEEDGRLSADVRGHDRNGFTLQFEAVALPRQKRITLSFDDAPRKDSAHFSGVERTRQLLESLASVQAPPVVFYATARNLDFEGDARMRMYASAGHYIGNHSFSHRRPGDLGVDAYLDDVRRADVLLRRYGTFVPLYRYPFLDEGRDIETRDALREGLAVLGYRNGYVTVDNYDFYIDGLFQRAVEQGLAVNFERLRDIYVDILMQAVRHYDDVADRYLEHDPIHVLLLHENDLAAMFVDDLVMALRAEGWTLVDGMDAYDDSIARRVPDTLFNGQGRVAAIAEAAGAPRRALVHPLEDTEALDELFLTGNVFGAGAGR